MIFPNSLPTAGRTTVNKKPLCRVSGNFRIEARVRSARITDLLRRSHLFVCVSLLFYSLSEYLKNILESKLHDPSAIISSHNAGRIRS